jgi:hypothetical protein
MKNYKIDRIGVGAIFLTALLSPCCFPLFAFGASALGLGGAELFGRWTMPVFLGLIGVFLIGLLLSYRRHRCLYPLLVGVPGAGLIVYGYSTMEMTFIYAGMFVLLASAIVNHYRNRLHSKGNKINLISVITCPECGFKNEELMPENACTFFYQCSSCSTTLKPKQGDCCVYCSYGTVPCPPIQSGNNCCA